MIEFWCLSGPGCGSRISFFTFLDMVNKDVYIYIYIYILGDRHFIRYIVTHQGATLQRPWRSLRLLSALVFYLYYFVVNIWPFRQECSNSVIASLSVIACISVFSVYVFLLFCGK